MWCVQVEVTAQTFSCMSGGALAGNIRHMISEVDKNGRCSVTLVSSGSVEDVQRYENGPFRSGSDRAFYALKTLDCEHINCKAAYRIK